MKLKDKLDTLPEVVLRIPGEWDGPEELSSALPEGCHLVERGIRLPDGETVALVAMPPDDDFPRIFATSCRGEPSPKDRKIVEEYRANVCLAGPGGSIPAARRMIEAGAAIIRAGGAGVFIDNSALSHTSDDWLAIAGDGDDAAVQYAFVSLVGDVGEIWSIGMHVLGCRDAVIPRSGDEESDRDELGDFLACLWSSGANLLEGDLIGDPERPRFRLVTERGSRFPPGSPMHSPYGRWRLEPLDSAAAIE